MDATKLIELLDRTDDFLDKIIHERARDNRRAQKELERMGHSVLIDDDMTMVALRLRGELVKAIGELKPITAADGKLYCCFIDEQERHCKNTVRYWVGTDGVHSYWHSCEEHLKDMWEPGYAIQDMQTGQMLDRLPEIMAMAAPQSCGDSDVAALAEAAQPKPLHLRVFLDDVEIPIIAERSKISSFCPFAGEFTINFAAHVQRNPIARLPCFEEPVRIDFTYGDFYAATFEANIVSWRSGGCLLFKSAENANLLGVDPTASDPPSECEMKQPEPVEPERQINFREFL